ncbi:DNA-directed RNA polymerase III subunit RPC5-like [Pollicipes pollicipes]|uniref:DNA-directed RNA polymerase III subunit RPC5-like n=1 Tax=Pollicipes pollicipes TaxID=41117 RepID=UPI0018859269|nr:DNA-directed RNA polymerase III subunit RPC5-like [Pollicipes pollicipes]XP_037074628.1 DNA-directed RNA polymerase III subunit RPC5-like [Pollicipes pollicipes]XP_037074631.1 DNA-directed RNA polymerase III subunit RPC5-like [Pollicipes pollicipes]
MQAPVIKKEKEDEDDEVVQEMPVYLSKGLQEKLWVLQYPVRPAHMTYDHAHFLEAKLKPEQHQLKLSLEINTASASYETSKGEQIALNVDGTRLTRDHNDLFYGGSVMDRQTLSSTLVTPCSRRYCLGVVSDGELHLSPVDAVVALRPSFDYLDRGDKKGRQEARELGEDVSGDEDEPDGPSTERVTVKFARPEPDRIKQARERSYQYLKRKQDEQPWVPTTVHKRSSASSETEWQKLLCSRTDDLSLAATMDQGEYKQRLLPEPSVEDITKRGLQNEQQMSLRSLRGLPLAEQIRALMIRLKVCQFGSLLPLLPRGTAPGDAVRVLQQTAQLVRGLWVVRSDVLYPKGGQTPRTGVPNDLLARGRDYMLYQFTQRTFVGRAELAEQIRLPAEDVLDLLQQVAELMPGRGWRMRLKPDPHHERSFPDVVQRQQMLWEAKHQQLMKAFRESGRTEGAGPAKPRRRRQRSQRDSFSASSDNESSGEAGSRKQRRNSGVKVKTEPAEAKS